MAGTHFKGPIYSNGLEVPTLSAEGTSLVSGDGSVVPLSPPSHTWAGKPTAAASGSGTIVRITDVGVGAFGSLWASDGTNWRPLNGSVVLANLSATLASPVATQTGGTGSVFTAASVSIPAGMLIPASSQIQVVAHVRRTGTGGTNNMRVYVGTASSASDSDILTASMAATNNLDQFTNFWFQPWTSTALTSVNWGNTGNGSSTGAAIDRSTNFNTAAAMYLNFGIRAANAADTFNLISSRVVMTG